MAEFKLREEKKKLKEKVRILQDGAIALCISVIITVLLGLFPRVDYTPGSNGHGLPFVWYSKWRIEGAPGHVYFDRFLVDLLIVFLLVALVMFETYAIKKIRRDAAKNKPQKVARKKAQKKAHKKASKADGKKLHFEAPDVSAAPSMAIADEEGMSADDSMSMEDAEKILLSDGD